MMEVMVTTGLLELKVMQSSSQIITTNKPTSTFLQAGCPSCWRQSTEENTNRLHTHTSNGTTFNDLD